MNFFWFVKFVLQISQQHNKTFILPPRRQLFFIYFILIVGGSSAPFNHGKSAAVKGENPTTLVLWTGCRPIFYTWRSLGLLLHLAHPRPSQTLHNIIY